MPNPSQSQPPKPISRRAAAEITRLPELTPTRRWFRRLLHRLARLLAVLLTRLEAFGLENVPLEGPALIVTNHLGDADMVAGLAISPRLPDFIAKIELFDFPLLGWIMQGYGVIWVRRGVPDRRALRAALEGLSEGRLIAIAPEGRESVTGALEEGTHGAAFLALRSGAPVLPVTVTGTENFYRNLRRFKRTPISITVGRPFHLSAMAGARHAELEQATQEIMKTLARQLPPEYRGVYQ